ncbi:zinc finger TRAF-type-containing protein 1-A-like isoform X1 [Clavelina lepadiformis]|uniref:zinc finger TRAF-type-containing protein 1-A-like isoform X1 n=1 Tax=Clavelina lepadiformis TaxID=159417 RepID=UPI0040410C7E
MAEHDCPSTSNEKTEDEVPPAKKIKVIADHKKEKLEERLNYILSCTVCLDLPSSVCMQCCHGHLMCVGCYHHLLADGRLKDEQATCPSCRVDITRGSCIRNLAVEKAISELPVQCSFCSGVFSRSNITLHERCECNERVVKCRFKQLGCHWSGPAHELDRHVDSCSHSMKSPTELLQCLNSINSQQQDQISAFNNIMNLLSCEHISYTEVQLRPYRTDDFVTKLFYESNRFHLLGQTWAVKAFVTAVEQHPSNPTLSAERGLTYQLLLKSKISEPLEIDILLLRAPYDDVIIEAKPCYTRFTSDITESTLEPLKTRDVNRLLGSKVINIRLFMFQHKR